MLPDTQIFSDPVLTDAGTSPHQEVKPARTPEALRHKWFDMDVKKAEFLLDLSHRSDLPDQSFSDRGKLLAIIKRKLINQLLVPTSGAKASYHLWREIEPIKRNAAKSVCPPL